MYIYIYMCIFTRKKCSKPPTRTNPSSKHSILGIPGIPHGRKATTKLQKRSAQHLFYLKTSASPSQTPANEPSFQFRLPDPCDAKCSAVIIQIHGATPQTCRPSYLYGLTTPLFLLVKNGNNPIWI